MFVQHCVIRGSGKRADFKTMTTPEGRFETDPPAYTSVQPPGEPREIRQGELFEPFPPFDVLLCSPHWHYLTLANHEYNNLNVPRSKRLDVDTEIKRPLREALEKHGSIPTPTFWIGADKIGANHHWVKPGTMRTFAIGTTRNKCYTVFEATDECICYKNFRSGRGTRKRKPDDGTARELTAAGDDLLKRSVMENATAKRDDFVSGIEPGGFSNDTSDRVNSSVRDHEAHQGWQISQSLPATYPSGLNVLQMIHNDYTAHHDEESAYASYAAPGSNLQAAFATYASISALDERHQTQRVHAHVFDGTEEVFGRVFHPPDEMMSGVQDIPRGHTTALSDPTSFASPTNLPPSDIFHHDRLPYFSDRLQSTGQRQRQRSALSLPEYHSTNSRGSPLSPGSMSDIDSFHAPAGEDELAHPTPAKKRNSI